MEFLNNNDLSYDKHFMLTEDHLVESTIFNELNNTIRQLKNKLKNLNKDNEELEEKIQVEKNNTSRVKLENQDLAERLEISKKNLEKLKNELQVSQNRLKELQKISRKKMKKI